MKTRRTRSAMIRLAVIALSKTSNVGRDHLIHRKRSPFPYEGKALTLLKVDETANVGRGTAQIAASEALPRCPGGAKPGAGMRGGLEGLAPPHRFKARAQASDGHMASTRAARKRRAQVCGEITVGGVGQGKHAPRRGVGLIFIHRGAVPLPLEGKA